MLELATNVTINIAVVDIIEREGIRIMKNNKALILIDLINEIVGRDGRSNGNYEQFIARDILNKSNEAVNFARGNNIPIIWIRVGFADDYHDIPKGSPMFQRAKEMGTFKLSEFGCQWIDGLDVREEDFTFVKKGVGAFAGNNLEQFLRDQQIDMLYFGGVSSLMAVQSSVRFAHDLGFYVNVIETLCASKTIAQHEESMSALTGLAEILTLDKFRGKP